MGEMWRVIGKLSGVLLAVTIALYFIVNALPRFAELVIQSDMVGREYMVGALIFLGFVIILIWGIAIVAFSRKERSTSPDVLRRSPDSRPPDNERSDQIRRMSEL